MCIRRILFAIEQRVLLIYYVDIRQRRSACNLPVMCNAQGNLVRRRRGWGRSQTTVQARDEEVGRISIADVPEETRHHRKSEDTSTTCSLHLHRRCLERASELACCSSKEGMGDV